MTEHDSCRLLFISTVLSNDVCGRFIEKCERLLDGVPITDAAGALLSLVRNPLNDGCKPIQGRSACVHPLSMRKRTGGSPKVERVTVQPWFFYDYILVTHYIRLDDVARSNSKGWEHVPKSIPHRSATGSVYSVTTDMGSPGLLLLIADSSVADSGWRVSQYGRSRPLDSLPPVTPTRTPPIHRTPNHSTQ